MYQVCFQRVFDHVARLAQKPIKWYYKDHEGIEVVQMDMAGAHIKGMEPLPNQFDTKFCLGLRLYLSTNTL